MVLWGIVPMIHLINLLSNWLSLRILMVHWLLDNKGVDNPWSIAKRELVVRLDQSAAVAATRRTTVVARLLGQTVSPPY